MRDYSDTGKTGSSEIWTKEAKRIDQITAVEDKINLYKEQEMWGAVLNSLEDYLRFQIEAIEETTKDETTGKKIKKQGINTNTYKEQMNEIQNLQMYWEQIQLKTKDPAQKRNNQQDMWELKRRIKAMIDKVYHNNIVYNLTYRKTPDPMEAWKT